MTRSQIITALVLVMVICLGLSALLVPERGGRTPTPARLVGFPPSEVSGVEVRLSGGVVQRLTRLAPDRWEIQDIATAARWPASTDRVRAFLRILDRTRGLLATESPPPASTTLTITSNLGEAVTLGLPATSLGGRSVILVEPQSPTDPTPAPFITTDEIPRLLAGDGILHWLDARAFAGIEGQVQEITVTSAGETMTIVRSGSGWRLTAPFAAPAESSLIAELLAGLQRLSFASPRLLEPGAEAPVADATTITLTATTRRPAADGSIAAETSSHTLTTTGPVGQSGQVPVKLFAHALLADSPSARGRLILGPLAATIDAGRLGETVRQPSFYIARRAVAAEPADIRSLSLTLPDNRVLHFSRVGAGWTRDTEPLSSSDAVAIESLVALLTRTPAVSAMPIDHPRPPNATLLATITAHGLGGLALATVDLAVSPLPDAAEDRAHALLTTADGLARYYTPESAIEAVRWVAEIPYGGVPTE